MRRSVRDGVNLSVAAFEGRLPGGLPVRSGMLGKGKKGIEVLMGEFGCDRHAMQQLLLLSQLEPAGHRRVPGG